MEIYDIYQLDREKIESLYQANTDDGLLKVQQFNHFRWLQIGGDAIQSIMDIEQPSQLLNPVNQIMVIGLSMVNAVNILNLGFGAGAFERFIQQNFSMINIEAVENNEAVIHCAREYFQIPTTWPVYHNDAINILQANAKQYELILCDIFANETHPQCLYEQAFFSAIARNLRPEGILCCNLTPSDENDLLTILLAMRKHFSHVLLYEIQDHFNFIVFAANHSIQIDQTSSVYQTLRSELQLNSDDIVNQLHTLPIPV